MAATNSGAKSVPPVTIVC